MPNTLEIWDGEKACGTPLLVTVITIYQAHVMCWVLCCAFYPLLLGLIVTTLKSYELPSLTTKKVTLRIGNPLTSG